jgi:ribosome-associated protein
VHKSDDRPDDTAAPFDPAPDAASERDGGAPDAAPLPDHLQELQWIVDALDDKRAKDVVCLDLSALTASVDAFVIATAESQPQLQALEEAVRERMKEHGHRPRGVEAPSTRWVLIDYGGVIVHLMSPEAREFYDLEGLWADAEPIPVTPA